MRQVLTGKFNPIVERLRMQRS